MAEDIVSPTNIEKGMNGIDSDLHHSTNPSPSPSLLVKVINYITEETTFFRAHLAAFTFIPLIFSGIFYASNGRYHISFLDSMFLCYSAMTVTGLSTVNLSTTTAWQQVILYFLMTIGDITVVSWTMVLIRKRFFKTHCEYVVAQQKKSKSKSRSIRSRASFMRNISAPIATFKQREPTPRQDEKKTSGTSSHSSNPPLNLVGPTPRPTLANIDEEQPEKPNDSEGNNITNTRAFSSSPKSEHLVLSPVSEHSLRSPPAVDFASSPTDRDQEPRTFFQSSENFVLSPVSEQNLRSPLTVDFALSTTISPRVAANHPMLTLRGGRAVPRRGTTMLSTKGPSVPGVPDTQSSKHQYKYTGLGGFPGPTHLLASVLKHTAPRAYRKMERSMTLLSRTTTLEADKTAWLDFDLSGSGLVVGRNSDFRTETLSDEEVEGVGGAEFRALRMLGWLVPTYFVVSQLLAVLLFLPWLSVTEQYNPVFAAQPRLVSKSWFSFFQVMGAYTGGGLSLVDLGMVPFQNAYLMIFALGFSILAGNHALPIFLRLVIWISSKIVPEDSETQKALSFLLDHPRRCFLYLFPSHQTWFLVICLVLFSGIEWVGFLVLNIGLPAYESIPTGPRVIAGLFQGLAVRASGFAIVPLASLAPALLFLYVVMMYIAVYPVALSIRTTNVYEERSLGVFEAPPDDEDEEPADLDRIPSGKERVGRYIGWHLRRQLSIDIWWLVWAVFLIAIVERHNLLDESKKWFDLFRVLFELVSAFGGIGLSLGFPDDNFSFVGAMSPLSKLIVIVVMVRGRHRGLPVAVDRAVLLPSELITSPNAKENDLKENGLPPQPYTA
ncbi:hypothetical protein GALMADRAFT_162346 [Galerina marginata CBS 339.88]|uniref:Potassium transport protein n=1 Tax=Galerina marginata (strain CBS 339.88) TaxID=685588 RepID=A0A067S4W2_GALM3|nr:hypothetical protein GALMADRAFT_162346 [Galerina marginata CBS 339.88]